MPVKRPSLSRRTFLRGLVGTSAALAATAAIPQAVRAIAPAQVTSDTIRPVITHGVSSGDLAGDQAIIWSRSDRPAQMLVELATVESFAGARLIQGPISQEASDFTAKLNIDGLPAGQRMFYRVRFQVPGDERAVSEPITGSFRTPPGPGQTVSFVWSGDTAGQGYGINPEWGGMRIYNTMGWYEPDFFIHSGDTIYADNPLQPEVTLPDGTIWRNLVTEEKAKVAETLREFRGNYAYNLLDEHVRHFQATVPIMAQWDDHEVVNNWWPGQILGDNRYTVKDVSLLAARSRQAFMEYMPVRGERIDRVIRYGPSLDVFFLDMRSYRAPNGPNDQTQRSAATDLLGREQIRRLKLDLLSSNATWKVIASDMPIGLLVYDNFVTRSGSEAVANGDGPPLGRELEIVDLLRFIKYNEIRNVVWLTADVHYTAAHYYDPNKARFSDFDPFWEFVSGPLNAGTFGPNDLDPTFGPQVIYQRVPPAGRFNLPPSAGMQFFGHVTIDGPTQHMRVTLRDLAGTDLYTKTLDPA
ncbi:MAG: alkaline phosphatase [Oscillochloris sp.]|nr:alkaline phosphatase [Oscillochloris sp.]